MPKSSENPNASADQSLDENTVPGNIADVDLQALAEEIIALLKTELRLENDRRGWRPLW